MRHILHEGDAGIINNNNYYYNYHYYNNNYHAQAVRHSLNYCANSAALMLHQKVLKPLG